MRTIQLLSSIVSVFLVSLTLHAADYHVWHAGLDASDDGPGTLDKPWKTITKAAATVQAGDTVFIHAGIYAEAVAVKNAGSEPRPIVFKAVLVQSRLSTRATCRRAAVRRTWAGKAALRPSTRTPSTASS